MKGLLIIIEGVDHAGKTTQRELLANKLREAGHDVVVTREPGGTPYAERIRALALDPQTEEAIHPETELLLMSAARVQHIRNMIKPKLAEGKIVICDRFILSTFAYQVFPHVTDTNHELADMFYGLMPYIVGDIEEPVTFFLNLPVEERQARALARGKENNHLDNRSDEFYIKVNEAFTLATQTPNCITVDANRPIDVISEEMFGAVTSYLERREQAIAAAAAAEANPQPADNTAGNQA
jgi:dTMP kinase